MAEMQHMTHQMSFKDAIRATLAGFEFQYDLPPEVKDAMHAGLIATGDDCWMWSDNVEKTNYLVLTPAGCRMAHNMGLTGPPEKAAQPVLDPIAIK